MAASPPTGVGGARRKGQAVRPLAIEVCGPMDDPCVKAITALLRLYHSRYSSTLRTIYTLLTSPFSEEEIFGCSSREGIVKAPQAAVTANGTVPVVHRLHSSDVGGGSNDPLASVKDFMKYAFLSLVMVHNFTRLSPQDRLFDPLEASRLLVRDYVHESSRTVSFLVADLSNHTAALIDPQWDVTCYEADLDRFHLKLGAVFLTHCAVDIRSGVLTVKERHPEIHIASGLPLQSAGSTHSWALSDSIGFTTVAVPSFSPENIVVELHIRGTLIAVFTGTVWSTDSTARPDYYCSFPLEDFQRAQPASESERRHAATTVAFTSLRVHFRERYFEKLPPLLRDRVLLLPSHGGYNHVTPQLDLFWGCYLADFSRALHTRRVLATLDTFEAYSESLSTAVPLPKPRIFSATRAANVGSLVRALQLDCVVIPPPRLHEAPMPLFVDCREGADYHLLHMKGAVCVPMSFPAEGFGAKKAELWLQCLLLPYQPVVALCALPEHRPIVRRRIELLSPDVSVEVYTLDQLLREVPAFPEACCRPSAAYGGAHFFSAPCLAGPTENLPAQLTWVQHKETLYRLDDHYKLSAVEPRKTAVVVDVRTPFEFRNGSHQHSIPFTLSDLCDSCAYYQLPPTTAGIPRLTLAAALTASLKKKFYAVTTSDPQLARYIPDTSRRDPMGWKEIIFYCAAGYRSIIASSIFQRAFELDYNGDGTDSTPWPTAFNIRITDVPGGALQLMTQRPDLWQVKDRSIICIS
eukprot:gene7197-5057_t